LKLYKKHFSECHLSHGDDLHRILKKHGRGSLPATPPETEHCATSAGSREEEEHRGQHRRE
jgi:hypothetical protein